MGKTHAALALVTGAVLTVAAPAPALEPEHPLTGYALSSWVERDGVPIGPVRSIVQDDAGYLWLATDAGLLRFDGVRFAPAASLGYDLPTADARTLLISRHDRALWIGFAGEAGVRVIRQGRVESPGTPHALRAAVTSLAEDASGGIWAATDKGLHRHQGGQWSRVPLAVDEVNRSVATVYSDRSGTLWAGASGGLFRRVDGRHFERSGPSSAPVFSITEDRHGRIWVTDPVAGFRPAREEGGTQWGREGLGLRVFHDRRSNLWVMTRGQGLWRVRMSELGASAVVETATVKTGLTGNGVWAAFEDREGNLWIGTQQGLNRLTPHDVTPIELGLARTVEAGPGSEVWAGTAGGLLQLTGGIVTRVPLPTDLDASDVRSLFRDEDGTLWVGTNRGLGRLAHGRFSLVPLGSSTPLMQVRSITGDGRRGLWLVDAARGLLHWSRGRLDAVATPIDGAPGRPAFAYTDRHGRLWVALEGGRLGVIDSGRPFRKIAAEDGFPPRTLTSIDAMAEDGAGNLWLGGSGGLTRLADGRFVTMTQETGLPGRRVRAIAHDHLGYVWLATDGALVRFHPDEFAKAVSLPGYRMEYRHFDTSRGVGGVPVASGNEGVARAADGGLWFVTGWGLTFVDPRTIAAQPPSGPLPVRVEDAVADEERYAATDGAVLPPGTSRLRIDYTALQLTSPTRVRFRYKLEGFDAEWADVGTRRQAFFTNLPPRDYRFVVQAQGPDRAWSSEAATWSFSIEPMFHQTYAFYAICAAGLALFGWTGWRFRVRKVRREVALVFAERMRLSRELHDTVLQNLASVAVQCSAISNTLETIAPAAREQLVGVRKQVEEYIRETRQSVWDLRSPMLDDGDLAAAFRQIGRRATDGSGVTFDLMSNGRPRRYSAKLENEILRIGQEAIQNAVRHAHAERIRVELTFARDHLLLRVTDDGCGLEAGSGAHDADGHMGLLGMKERAEQIGGRLNIGPEGSRGTNVELVVPAAAHG